MSAARLSAEPAKANRALGLVAALAPPVALLLFWHFKSQMYPRGDASTYTALATTHYYAFQKEGLLAAVRSLYAVRDWRPTIQSALLFPFLVACGGKVRPSIALAESTFLVVFLSYLFATFRSFLSLPRAILGVWLIASVPWLLGTGTRFMPELMVLMCASALLYHLEGCGFFSKLRPSLAIGAWTGLAGCIRPVETCLIFVPALVLYSWRSMREKWVGPRDLLVSGVVFVFAFGLTVYPALAPNAPGASSDGARLCAAVLALGLVHGLRRRLRLSAPYLWAVTLALGLALAWYLPFTRDYIDYAYEVSYGHTARVYAQRAGVGKLAFFWMTALRLWLFVLPGLAAITVLAAALWEAERKMLRHLLTEKAWMIGCALAAGFVYIICASFAANADPRYYVASAFILIFGFSAMALRTRLYWLLIPLLLYQAAVDTALVSPPALSKPEYRGEVRMFDLGMQLLEWPRTWNPDFTSGFFFSRLMSHIDSEETTFAVLQSNQTDECQNWPLEFVLRARALEAKRDWHFSFELPDEGDKIEVLRKFGEYVLVGPIEPEIKMANPLDAQAFAKIVETWRANRLSDLSLTFVSSIPCTPAAKSHFLLLKTRN